VLGKKRKKNVKKRRIITKCNKEYYIARLSSKNKRGKWISKNINKKKHKMKPIGKNSLKSSEDKRPREQAKRFVDF
jgi:hypothetical protein